MKRRQFVRSVLAGSAVSILPFSVNAAVNSPMLILVELKGGNDGLNTLIPFSNKSYYRHRPKLAIARDQVLQIGDSMGLHPELKDLHRLFKGGGLAVLQGVGYDQPNLSHFRSIDIWETGSDSDEVLSQGWLDRAWKGADSPKALADGIVIGDGNLGPLRGTARPVLVIERPNQIMNAKKRVQEYSIDKKMGTALSHVLQVENILSQSLEKLQKVQVQKEIRQLDVGKGPFANSVKAALRVLSLGHPVPFLKLSLGGFDTHVNQLAQHRRLMENLNTGLASLERGLKILGLWSNSLVLTYSEFGRRPKENASGGTDHGTANVHFALGGKVKGGVFGQAPSLDNLSGDGNLIASMDYRSVYSEVLSKHLKFKKDEVVFGRTFDRIGFLT